MGTKFKSLASVSFILLGVLCGATLLPPLLAVDIALYELLVLRVPPTLLRIKDCAFIELRGHGSRDAVIGVVLGSLSGGLLAAWRARDVRSARSLLWLNASATVLLIIGTFYIELSLYDYWQEVDMDWDWKGALLQVVCNLPLQWATFLLVLNKVSLHRLSSHKESSTITLPRQT